MSWINDTTNLFADTLHQYSPQIKIYTGTGMIIGGSVWACYRTTKLPEINERNLEIIDEIHEKYGKLSDETRQLPNVAKQYRNDIFWARVNQAKDIAVNYAGPAITELAGAALIGSGTNELTSRLAETALAYTSLLGVFKDYRRRTAEKVGIEEEEKIYHGLVEKEVNEVDENGKVATKKVREIDPNAKLSPYAVFFAEDTADGWDPNPEVNKNFLLLQQAQANEIFMGRLRTHGKAWLYLNEVYDMLGFPCTDAGQDVGWFYCPDCEEGNTEATVDFGIQRPVNRRFLASSNAEVLENTCLLDFNCCGNIRPFLYRKSGGKRLGSTRARLLPKR